MEEKQLLVNVLPSPTYNWLRMNDAEVQVPVKVEVGNPMITRPASVETSAVNYAEIQDIPGGMGYDMDTFLKSQNLDVLKVSVKDGVKAPFPVKIEFTFRNGDAAANVVEIAAGDDSDVTVVMDYAAEKSAEGFGAVQTKVRLGRNAHVELVQIQRLGSSFRFLNDIGAKTGDGARFEQISLIVSGEETYQGSRTDLIGEKSSLKTDVGYLLRGKDHLDMNYIANHIGKKTNCEINASGVLRDESFKLFRGTIDLRKGAKGAVGNEMEDVLLVDDKVDNQTIPVILCDEEDVEGNHGATIGRLDESLLFYLESRGLSRTEVYEMMADARIDAVINKIPEEKTRDEVFRSLKGHGAVTFSGDLPEDGKEEG